MHEEGPGCPRAMELDPGVVAVQAAPDLFCDPPLLAEYLLRNGDAFREKRGVKVVHLVRDPFDLAISNWIYHAQFPTPELWVKTAKPCQVEMWFERQTLGDLVGPTLAAGEDPVMRPDDFRKLNELCKSLYRQTEETRGWSYYTHLRHLDPPEALSLATTHMMAQGRSGGDILRMANNVVRLDQVRKLEDQIRLSQHMVPPPPSERMIQVLTLSMEEFTTDPGGTALRFLDFALGDAASPEAKRSVAAAYEAAYLEKKRGGDKHMTADKRIENGKGEDMGTMKRDLERFLREHELFGRVLGGVERVVNDALRESGSTLVKS
ncbi:hypothetical protein ACHAWF_005089 [Thalassiosira exigua]